MSLDNVIETERNLWHFVCSCYMVNHFRIDTFHQMLLFQKLSTFPGCFGMYNLIDKNSQDIKQNKNQTKFRTGQYASSVQSHISSCTLWVRFWICTHGSYWKPLFGIPGRVNFVCLNAHHDENASYSTCSLIRKAVQMAFFDRELINPAILWEKK